MSQARFCPIFEQRLNFGQKRMSGVGLDKPRAADDVPCMTHGSQKTAAATPLDTEIVVVGGGAAGLTLAAALGTAGLPTVVIDREAPAVRAAPGEGDRTTALTYGSIRVLQGVGAWPRVEPSAAAITGLHIADNWSPLVLQVDPADIGDHPYGYNVDNGDLRAGLLERLEELPSVTHLAPAPVVGFDREGGRIAVHLEDGRSVRASLLVGADGRQSPTRAWSGIRTRHWQYDQTAIACVVAHDRPHRNVAVEHVMPSGPFALVPMPDLPDGRHRSAIIWCERRRDAPLYLDLPQTAFDAELQRRCGNRLGTVNQVGRRFAYPLSGLHARRYVGERLALMGEAAHAVHPIAAQGLNLSMRDAAALAEVVADARRLGLDIGDAGLLRRYERWRRVDVMTTIASTDGFYRLFANSVPPLKAARDIGLAVLNRLPGVKRRIFHDAMGLSGTVPRLVKGEAL